LDRSLLGHAVPQPVPAMIKGFKKMYVGEGYYTLEPDKNSVTPGMAYPIDEDKDFEILDNYEDLYERVQVSPFTGDNTDMSPMYAYILKGIEQ